MRGGRKASGEEQIGRKERNDGTCSGVGRSQLPGSFGNIRRKVETGFSWKRKVGNKVSSISQASLQALGFIFQCGTCLRFLNQKNGSFSKNWRNIMLMERSKVQKRNSKEQNWEDVRAGEGGLRRVLERSVHRTC